MVPIKPFMMKPMFLPFAWLQLVLEGNSMSTYLLTKHSLTLWQKCHPCIYKYLKNVVDPNNMLEVYRTEIIFQEHNHIEILMTNGELILQFNMQFCQNDWYIDLDGLRHYLNDECNLCLEH